MGIFHRSLARTGAYTGVYIVAALLMAGCKPTTTDINLTTPANTATGITLNASDIDSSQFQYQVGAPQYGTLSGTAPNLTYTPASGYTGWDHFSYTASHNSSISRETRVTIFVEEPPAADWVTLQGNASHDGHVPVTLHPDGFSLLWQSELGAADYHPPVSNGDMVFIVGDHSLSAVRSVDGNESWRHDFNQRVFSVNPPAYADGQVLLQVGKECSSCSDKPFLYSFEATTGSVQYTSLFGAQWEHYLAPTPYGDAVYVNAGAYGGAQAFDLSSGTSLWFANLPQFSGWTPAVNEQLVTGYMDGALYLLARNDGSALGSIPDPDYSWHGYSVNFAPVLTGTGQALVVESGRLINFNLDQLALEWQLSGQFAPQPAYAGNTLYVASGTSLQARSLTDGNLIWEWTGPSSLDGNIIVTRNLVIVSSATTTHALDRASGEAQWQFNQGGHILLGSDLVLYILSDDGILSAINTQQDYDQDGLPTAWERRHGLDPYFTDDANGDPDGDLLINSEEYRHHANPNRRDSDDDGLDDYEEASVYGTLANKPDSDGDGMQDGWEVRYGLAPNDALDAEQDLDGDGASNYEEAQTGTDPTDSGSYPPPISELTLSFENGLPAGWEASDLSAWSVTDEVAHTGQYALRHAANDSSHMEWSGYFAGNMITVQAYRGCNNFSQLLVDTGVESFAFIISNSGWSEFSFPIGKGLNRIRFRTTSSCPIYLDSVQATPLSGWSANEGAYLAIFDGELRLYSDAGELLRRVNVPDAGGCCDYPRDVTLLDDGRIAIFNGTFTPQLSVYDPGTHRWSHLQADNWATVNNLSYGGIADWGDYVFVTSMDTALNSHAGIIRFTLSSKQAEPFGAREYIDLTLGQDGLLYALSGSVVDVYHPATLTLLTSINISASRAIAVDALGTLYSATWGGEIRRHDAAGAIINSLVVGGSLFDLNLGDNGLLVASDRDGRLFATHTELMAFSNIVAVNGAEFADIIPQSSAQSAHLTSQFQIQSLGLNDTGATTAATQPLPDAFDEAGFSPSPQAPTRY
ncbi:PQQ-binding-like beta-propeller repeat protein [Ketobacter sp.]|uniref:outer membrane protein assembly factor BamB family protein n=1 Tax=Ketobacter sp. TaxID=2083498 RepID=UPI000F16B02F|nr:PQQ-binding-like beta-propeller repeat protein [Ketobacter sp.]RLU01351.1 MAG: hypothetical protein D9N14_03180 [Ketobacter sp.]